MDWPPDRRLQLRMAATLFALALTLVVATVAVWAVVSFLSVLVVFVVGAGLELGGSLAGVRTGDLLTLWLAGTGLLTLGLLASVAHRERAAPDYAVATTGARRIERADAPHLFETVRSTAQQADLPVPTLFLAPTETPLSLVTGYRESTANLVVSRGLLDVLDDRELEAVVAHELAHVKNRDATVMTVTGLLTMAAARVFELLRGPTAGVEHGRVSRASYADAMVTVGLVFAAPVWAVSRLLGASLSRAREFAADRGAVALTGDPAGLASALETIDDRIVDAPTDRQSATVARLSVVGRNRTTGSTGSTTPEGLRRVGRRLVASHPPTTVRTDRLRALEQQQEAMRVSYFD